MSPRLTSASVSASLKEFLSEIASKCCWLWVLAISTRSFSDRRLDLRRTGATRMQRLGFEKEVVDCCLNHIDDDAYLQHDYYDNMAKVDVAVALGILEIADSVEAPQWNKENPAAARRSTASGSSRSIQSCAT